ncbi:maltooligosyl trehalose synthase [Brachybacterium phenoliresistens]|uniref:Maltooligosyl trehalose synthase n=1 Tax=Brachybacterium phenoliresistens TaxID=396014 RepID=Z9JX37_9MICO|nr:malto-oligosyltrehalose synthase [Brachybacterium phenoliresistens]EWS82940.1 maltooligosyl trehalose synthase [Brachybacterium phenoliresistens]
MSAIEESARIVPTSTYRLQLHAGFTADDAAAQVPYLAELGVGHLFASPVLQASPGSTHGYDVVDHSRISTEIGGEAALRRLSEAAHAHGMGLIVDVVPNHMAIPTPIWHNRALWDVLEKGPASEYSSWFDVDASAAGSILVPVLGRPIGAVLADGEITTGTAEIPQSDGTLRTQHVVRYFDHVLPIAQGTESLGIADLLERQWYRLAHWKVADDELNYRRFFDVDTLAAVRVEDPAVFEATHAVLLRLQAEGVIDGFRIDHPDGLADPRGYLRDLDAASGGAWTVVEKILEGDEHLPGDFPCAGTTGYDALWRVGGLFHDPQGALGLTHVWQRFTGDLRPFEEIARESTEQIVSTSLWAEIERLTSLVHRICQEDIRLRDTTRRMIQRVLVELLGAMDRYRAYIVPGEPAPGAQREVIEHAADRAREQLGEDEDVLAALDIVVALVCGDEVGSAGRTASADRAELIVRFAQTCGPVHAKALEDTAFYRYPRFLPVTEVGADPERIGVEVDDLHEHCRTMVRTFPDTMTTLSTHDTKRSEDVRARLAVLTEASEEWALVVLALHRATAADRGDHVDPAIELLLWQTLAATCPLPGSGAEEMTAPRLEEHLTKAMREAKVRTSWTEPDAEYEQEVLALGRAALESEEVAGILADWTRRTAAAQRAAILGQKLVQLTMPGVPDVYQGSEGVTLTLVDPDNRRPVDHAAHARTLAHLSSGAHPDGVGQEKLWLTHRALRLRRERPDLFRGRSAAYRPVPTTTGQAIAFGRAVDEREVEVVTVATRLPQGLARRGGWGEASIVLPEGPWREDLTGRVLDGGEVPLARLLDSLPVALLVREGPGSTATAPGGGASAAAQDPEGPA